MRNNELPNEVVLRDALGQDTVSVQSAFAAIRERIPQIAMRGPIAVHLPVRHPALISERERILENNLRKLERSNESHEETSPVRVFEILGRFGGTDEAVDFQLQEVERRLSDSETVCLALTSVPVAKLARERLNSLFSLYGSSGLFKVTVHGPCKQEIMEELKGFQLTSWEESQESEREASGTCDLDVNDTLGNFPVITSLQPDLRKSLLHRLVARMMRYFRRRK